jgi:hypothetical protein
LQKVSCIIMARIEEMLSLLHTLIKSISSSIVSINKCTLAIVLTCLQVMHSKVDMFKIHKKLSDELSFLRHQHSHFILL